MQFWSECNVDKIVCNFGLSAIGIKLYAISVFPSAIGIKLYAILV